MSGKKSREQPLIGVRGWGCILTLATMLNVLILLITAAYLPQIRDRMPAGYSANLKATLDQGSKIGDWFGVLNTLVAGAAFIALIYTINKQHADRREDAKADADKRRQDNILAALTSLTNTYAMIYAGDREGCEQEASLGKPSILAGDKIGPKARDTVKGKLYWFAKDLETNLRRIRSSEDLASSPKEDDKPDSPST